MKRLILLPFLFILFLSSIAQREKGSWQNYLSFSKATKICVGNNTIYCVTEGGLFSYDLQDNSIQKFSESRNLSGDKIKTIAYSDDYKVLVVAYMDSNVDLVFESSVVNVSDIQRKQITGSKAINNITFIGDDAYLSCGFGMVVINISKKEIKDTYIIGAGGALLGVYDVESDGNYLYAATDEGIIRADLTGTNLLDYRNWIKINNIPHFNEKFNQLAFYSNRIIANYTQGDQVWDGDMMYVLAGDDWIPYNPQIKYVYDIQVNQNYLVITGRDEVFLIDNSNVVKNKWSFFNSGNPDYDAIQPRSSVITGNGSVWIADYNNALVRIYSEGFEEIMPYGPLDNYIYSLNMHGSDLWIAPGGTNGWERPRFQHFKNNQWKYFTTKNHSELDGLFNIVSVIADPSDENHFFVASWSGGLLEYRGDEFINRYTHQNSLLQTILPPDNDANYIRIGGMDFDSQGNLWMTNSEVARNLVKLSPDGDWEAFALPEVANIRTIGQLKVTQNDDKWILIPRGHDAYVVDKTGTQKRRLQVTSYFNNGKDEKFNRMNDVYSIAEDHEGAVWIGTSIGVAVYSSPARIWDTENFYAVQPSLDLNDGLYHPLLETETVTAIAVDGANRKWLGTKNSGVFLVSASGEEEILHFSEENSPLLSNTITSIAINALTGEVFFGTDEGLISYQGDATGGKDRFENVYVYPNPVRETYDGPVTITGLMENTDVKITDIGGNLVYHTQSLGGQAVWDGKNLNGNRVRTGIYLVFCNDETGNETHITKLLFIN